MTDSTTGTSPDGQSAKNSSGGMWLGLIAIVLGTFVSVLNSSLMSVALPKLTAVFGSDTQTMQWMLTGYMLASAMVIPMTGYLGLRFGNKTVFVYSVAGFTIGSVLCALAWSDTSVIFFRIVQGFAGGFIMPVGMSIIYTSFPREKVSTAIGLWGIAAMVAPALGPTAGGYLIQYYSWRWLFLINIPIGIFAVILGNLLLKNSQTKKGVKFDFPGAVLSMIFFGSILLALSKGQSEGWTSMFILSLFFVALFSLLLLLWVELGTETPVLDVRLFAIPQFTISTIASCLVMMGMMGGSFLAPLYLQNIQGLNAMQAGLVMMPQAIVMALMMPLSGKLNDKYGIIPIGLVGLTILGVTTLKLHLLAADTPNHWLIWIMSIRSIGIGLCMMPMTSAGMSAVAPHQIGNASPLGNVSRQVAGSMSIAIFTALMSSRQLVHAQHINESVTVDSLAASNAISAISGYVYQSAVDMSTATGAATSVIAGMIQKEALVRAIADTFYISAIPAFLCLPFVFFMSKRKAATPVKPQAGTGDKAAAPAGPAAVSAQETPATVKA
ncbi:Multidrug export protein EmrB [Paenibacillus solanacearum]|uniref:Multidrug export protein EmrB n=1 Tax=Paenibacillus solanacearum TaxID=2048548 RepID=A0A916K896_9BACL|nr:DHA2 family efflux MFS transporter permease subunit [Paenibacillus solanacearum]CAG7644393.1 Multidrug export protein EmrB [Paenibacillus solanacearum]